MLRNSIISPLAVGTKDNAPPGASQMVLIDERDRRLVLVELRLSAGKNPEAVRQDFLTLFADVFNTADPPPQPTRVARHYMRCVLSADEIQRLVGGGASPSKAAAAHALSLIYHVWPDFVISAHLDRSLTTVKADAAERTFNCNGAGIVWGVFDSGIDANHPHFAANATLSADTVATLHRDFTIPASAGPLTDPYGHGTHVAGIIAGHAPADQKLWIATNEPTMQGLPQWETRTLAPGDSLSGAAPKANLVSLKVLDGNGKTVSSVVLDAIDYVRTVNGSGRDLVIHGVNLSLGCSWPPTEFATGQSPLCRELDLLVGTGVVAVVSAGNAGAGGTIHPA